MNPSPERLSRPSIPFWKPTTTRAERAGAPVVAGLLVLALAFLLPVARASAGVDRELAPAGDARDWRAALPVASSGAAFTHETGGGGLAKATGDSFAIYGGPGSTEGRFQRPAAPVFGDLQGWTTVDRTDTGSFAVGDFGKTFDRLTDLDLCDENTTPQLTFIDDGTPPNNRPAQSTGGQISPTWNYGVVGGWVVNYTGGLETARFAALWNEAWSPEIDWDDPSTTADDGLTGGLELRYSVWEHLPRVNGIFHLWAVRSFPDPVTGGWGDWRDRGFVYFSDQPIYSRRDVEIGDLLEPNVRKVQIALGVIDLADQLGLDGDDATPGPWFDDVSLVKHQRSGPAIVVRDLDVFQDGFAHSGNSLDLLNLADQAARVDTGRDINPEGTAIVSGDSMLVRVAPLTPGTTLLGPPVMTWSLSTNALFDRVRVIPTTAVETLPGLWEGDVVGQIATDPSGQPVDGLYWFDLPDGPPRNPTLVAEPVEDPLVFPGDRLWMTITVTDTNNDSNQWLSSPEDPQPGGTLCGKGLGKAGSEPSGNDPDPGGQDPDEPDPKPKPKDTLPGFWDIGGKLPPEALRLAEDPTAPAQLPPGITQPDLLIWDDATDPDELDLAIQALGQLGVLPGRDFDVYSTYGPNVGASNGLGATAGLGASAAQLADYEVILYLAGDAGIPLLSDGSAVGGNDKGDDVGLLDAWRAQPGSRSVIYFADKIGSAMTDQGSSTQSHLRLRQGLAFLDDDRGDDVLGQPAPRVTPSGSPSVFTTEFIVFGGCDADAPGDAIDALTSTGAVVGHRFTDGGGTAIGSIAASVVHDRFEVVGTLPYRRLDVSFPFGLQRLRDEIDLPPDSDARSARARLLAEVLLLAGLPTDPGSATETPTPRAGLQVEGPWPSPFNPSTTLWLSTQRPHAVTVKIHDLRGRLIRNLFAGELPAGRTPVAWDGLDTRGLAVASGVYLVEVRASDAGAFGPGPSMREVRKVVLVK